MCDIPQPPHLHLPRVFPTSTDSDAYVPAGRAHHAGLLKALCFTEGGWLKPGDISKAAASFAACTLPVLLPCGCFTGEKCAALWKYKALTLQSIKENRGEKKRTNYLGLIKELPGEIATGNYKGKIKSSSEMRMTSWGDWEGAGGEGLPAPRGSPWVGGLVLRFWRGRMFL